MRRILIGVGFTLSVLVAVLATVIVEAHWEMRSIDPELPDRPDAIVPTGSTDAPVRISYITTAVQSPVGHPAFLLEWRDGRAFLIDTGMDREGALAFGESMEWLMGADPIEPHGSVVEQLGSEARRIRAVAFTHLHSDHTGGLASLCQVLERPLPVFQTSWQADRQNFMTSAGRSDLENAPCVRRERLDGGPALAIPGFPGLVAVAAGGHTPGSTLFFARVGETVWVLSGDIVNFKESLRLNRPKPLAYRLILVPEWSDRQEFLRLWLADLDARPGFTVVVSHDHDALQTSRMPAWAAVHASGLPGS
jgi:glyoxylase-like metal-dependent hydrolase (beta-lactamase superfamily II)